MVKYFSQPKATLLSTVVFFSVFTTTACSDKDAVPGNQEQASFTLPEPPPNLSLEKEPALSSEKAFIDRYKTNTTDNLSADSNAVIHILSGMQELWQTGNQWDNGKSLNRETTRKNIEYVVKTTMERTQRQTERAFIYDRQHQSHGIIDGLGPLASIYRRGARATSGIAALPETIPDQLISDTLPENANPDSVLGAGATDSPLGKVVQLINTARGEYSSGNPAKYTYQYPRPWRMTRNSRVVDTGQLDTLGFPVYASSVQVIPQLLRQRGKVPEKDGGFPSGHTNAAYLAAMAMAYAVPERFQEMMVRASDLGHSRIEAGMHSPLDVIGGRIMATALLAAILNDPENEALKREARAQALSYFMEQVGTSHATELRRFASSGGNSDRYHNHDQNRELVTHRLTYNLPRDQSANADMRVPKGAEVLLETRFPYLSPTQRRSVLRSTAVDSGYPLLDGPEQWGRLDLFTAADGYRELVGDVSISMDASLGGFNTRDHWRNDITGNGKLKKLGAGQLTLSGNNSYAGGTEIRAGALIAGSSRALGAGDLYIAGGGLGIADTHSLWITGNYTQLAEAKLTLTPHTNSQPKLVVTGTVTLAPGTTLVLEKTSELPARGRIPLIHALGGIRGEFSKIRYGEQTLALEYTENRVFLLLD